MKVKVFMKVLIIILLAMVLIPRVIYASNTIDAYFYIQSGEKINLCYETLSFNDNICIEDKILISLYQTLTNENYLCYFPSDTRILNVEYSLGYVSINFSKEILNLGGTDSEQHLIEIIKRTTFSLKEVNYLTILVEGKLIPLAEGSLISEEDFKNV